MNGSPAGSPVPDAASRENGSAADTPTTATGFHATVEKIYNDHILAARQVVTKDMELLAELEGDIEEDCDRLRDFLLAAKVSDRYIMQLYDH